jgi:hypothetical protein
VVRCREILGPAPPIVETTDDPLRRTADLPAQELLDEDDVTAETKPPDEQHCSFCGTLKTDVANLVTGPTVYICNECVVLCEDIIAVELPANNPPDA